MGIRLRRPIELVLAVLIAAGCFGAGPQGRLVKVWSLDVSQTVTTRQHERLSVFALGFSEDSRRIAAVVGQSWDTEFLLVIDTASPNRPMRFDVNPKIWQDENVSDDRLHWSSSGEWLIIGNTILELPGGHVCSLPDIPISPGYQFAGSYAVGAQLNPPLISLFDTGCGLARKIEDVRTSDGHHTTHISIANASSEPAFLVVTPNDISAQGATEILDIRSGEIRRRLPAGFALAKFADNGRAVCGAGGKAWHRSIDCVSTETGEAIGRLNGWNDPGIRAAPKTIRLVISDYARKLDFIDWRWYPGPLTKRVVWDYRSQKSIVDWKPQNQQVVLPTPARSQPYRFDISPDGAYIVEGGDAMVNLYRIEP